MVWLEQKWFVLEEVVVEQQQVMQMISDFCVVSLVVFEYGGFLADVGWSKVDR